MERKDILAAFIIGEASALLVLGIFENLRLQAFNWWLLPLVLPVLSLAGIIAAYFAGKKLPIVFQAAKFLLVGVLNTLVDLGILNVLILASGQAAGVEFSVFKGISFSVAVVNSYFWNKLWTFKSGQGDQSDRGGLVSVKTATGKRGKEFLKFAAISFIGFGINVGVASFIVNLIRSPFAFSGVSEAIWANVGAIIATVVSLAWNFMGYRFIVFKENNK